MPAAALLHKTRLAEFQAWLTALGREWRPSTAAYQVMQIKHGSGWQAIYERNVSPEHYSVPDPLVQLVQQFIRETREPRIPPGYTAEELERDNPFNAWMRDIEV